MGTPTDDLWEALERGDVDGVREAIRQGAHVGSREDYSPLEAAIEVGSRPILEMLLEAGADPNGRSGGGSHGSTPLFWAAFSQDVALVRTLLDSGARVDVAREDGEPPLHKAADQEGSEILRLLLKQPGVSECLARFDEFCQTPLITAVEDGHFENLRLPLEAGSDPNQWCEERLGETVMYYAVENASIPMVKLLLRHGADPRIDSWGGGMVLRLARQQPNAPELVPLLEEAIARLETANL